MGVKVGPCDLARAAVLAKVRTSTVLAWWRQGQVLAAQSGYGSQRAVPLLIPVHHSAANRCALGLLGMSLTPGQSLPAGVEEALISPVVHAGCRSRLCSETPTREGWG